MLICGIKVQNLFIFKKSQRNKTLVFAVKTLYQASATDLLYRLYALNLKHHPYTKQQADAMHI